MKIIYIIKIIHYNEKKIIIIYKIIFQIIYNMKINNVIINNHELIIIHILYI